MLARLLAAISSHPNLVLDHIESYVRLVQAEAQEYKQVIIRRFLAAAVFTVAASACVLLVSIAIMLWAVNQNQLWVLVAIPFVFGVIATAAYVHMSDKGAAVPFENVRAQAIEDARILKQATHAP
jgi:uncharacterized membrane protein YqjE